MRFDFACVLRVRFGQSMAKTHYPWKVVVAQLSERWLLIPEVCSLNPSISNFIQTTRLLLAVEKIKIKKKRPTWPIRKPLYFLDMYTTNLARFKKIVSLINYQFSE